MAPWQPGWGSGDVGKEGGYEARSIGASLVVALWAVLGPIKTNCDGFCCSAVAPLLYSSAADLLCC